MEICLLNPINKNRRDAMNKDLAGGMGTLSYFGNSFTSRLLSFFKKKNINLPIISFAFIQAILKNKGYSVDYIEGNTLKKEYDLILIYGSIVDFKNEINIANEIKRVYPHTKIGFFGSFPSTKPEIFKKADFVIVGEVESFILYEFKDIKSIPKIVNVKKVLDLNDLPSPDFDNFPIQKYSYFPAIKEKPFLVLQASKGCPYSCSYYCPYGAIQGKIYRIRSAERLFEDVLKLVKRYKVKGLQFRDPTFGLNKKQVRKFCSLLIKNKVKLKFGIETRIDLLDKRTLHLLFKAGLRNLNVGIETLNPNVAKINKRQLISLKHQEEIISYCNEIGIKVSAFYIIGFINDTEDSIKETIRYSIKLNTHMAQFVVFCPYPCTDYYEELKDKGLILTDDLERFNSACVVFKHNKLNPEKLLKLKEYAFKRYYFRIGYFLEFLKWRIREYWL